MGYRIKRLQDTARGFRASKDSPPVSAGRASGSSTSSRTASRARPARRRALAVLARPAPERAVDLSQLPILTKTELMERFDDIVTDRRLRRDELLEHLTQIDDDALYLGEFRVMTSSGSSGGRPCSSTTARPGGASS